MSETIDKVPFSKLKKLVEQIEKQPHLEDKLDETEISLELVLGSLFPNAYKNMLDILKDEHTKGFIEGINMNASSFTFMPAVCPSCGELTYIDINEGDEPHYCPHCGEKL